MFNVKLNAILLKTEQFKQGLWQQEVLIDMNKFPIFFKFGVTNNLVAMVTIQIMLP